MQTDFPGFQGDLAGHIEGALCLPPGRFTFLYPELQAWSAGQPLLVYGSAREFNLVDDLAGRLLESGEPQVVFLIDGIEAWQARGYPMESGPDGLLEEPAPETDQPQPAGEEG